MRLMYLSLGCLLVAACAAQADSESDDVVPVEPVVAGDGDYPATAVLNSFRETCSDLATLDAAETQILASGWTVVEDVSASPVGPVVEFGLEMARKCWEAKAGR